MEDQFNESFEITDDGQAEWAIGKIREAKAEQEKMEQHYKDQLEHIRQRTENTTSYMSQLLENYFNNVPRHVTKTGIEKYKLPSGELVRKPAGETYERDDNKLLEWCRNQHPEYIKVTEKPSWTDIKWHIGQTGELPDGVTLEETPAKFDIKVE